MKRYQYMHVTEHFGPMEDHQLNMLGAQGWHLSAAVPDPPAGAYRFIFARVIEEPPAEIFKQMRDSGSIMLDTHEHEPRASRRDPVVSSEPSLTDRKDS